MMSVNAEIYPLAVKEVNPHFDAHIYTQLFMNSYDEETDPIHPSQPRRRFFYTAVAYVLSSHAAQTLVDIVDTYGFIKPADIMVMKLMDLVAGIYVARPLLVLLPPNSGDSLHPEDSDIQHDKSPIKGVPNK
jgi:hypothetical protein